MRRAADQQKRDEIGKRRLSEVKVIAKPGVSDLKKEADKMKGASMVIDHTKNIVYFGNNEVQESEKTNDHIEERSNEI
jgi:hypothetical protein